MTTPTLPSQIPNPKKTLPSRIKPAPKPAETLADVAAEVATLRPTAAPVKMPPSPKQLAALEALMASKGGGRVATASRANGVLSTGLRSLDRALGGGLPKGQISEFAGDSGVGKTTLALKIIAEAQQVRGELCAWVDVEQSLDADLAQACGVDLDALIYDNPAYAEEATEFVLDLIETGAVSIIVVDSIGAYNPKKRLEDEVGKVGQPALRAKAVGELAERTIGPLAKGNIVLLAINHLTGKLATDFHGNQLTIAKGGRTWTYLKSCSLHLKTKPVEVVDGEVRFKLCKSTGLGHI